MTHREAMRPVMARILARAAEFMVEHDELTVAQCLEIAKRVEVLLYGAPGDQGDPIGMLGKSPLQSLKEKLRDA